MTRHDHSAGRRWRPIGVLGVCYAVLGCLILFWPTRVTDPFAAQLASLRSAIPYGDTLVEIAANVVLFVPLGIITARMTASGRRRIGLAACALVSALAELAQAALLPNRVASLRDVVANSLGAALGTLAVILRERHAHRPSGRRTTMPDPPAQDLNETDGAPPGAPR